MQNYHTTLKLLLKNSGTLITSELMGAPIVEWLNVELPSSTHYGAAADRAGGCAAPVAASGRAAAAAGRREGRRKGRQEGLREGLQEGELAILRRQIKKHFGAIPRWVKKRLAGRSAAELEELGLRLLDASSLEDLLR